MTAPVLKYPDFNEEFKVTTDASDHAIGAVLSQGPVGNDRPIAYASRVLSRAEQNYNTTEKELLAIVWAVKHFRPCIWNEIQDNNRSQAIDLVIQRE
ncbi:enzymatic polyprotein endonuclease reverse [Lasius niger]|uniref:Enzymatic polyprotein endonuclease reverse n=1 Tax=Lasius niger TaxID=67767 RepID=A0A0J7K3L1_LASNI|nr:enzymatic polyprotein endonuclease reverse [Lasius niger]